MARLDVYRVASKAGDVLVVDVQNGLLDHLGTRVVVPLLVPAGGPKPIAELNPTVEVGDKSYFLATQAVLSVPATVLKTPIGSLNAHRDAITRALEVLLVGY